jgi:ribosomal protein S9
VYSMYYRDVESMGGGHGQAAAVRGGIAPRAESHLQRALNHSLGNAALHFLPLGVRGWERKQ